MMMIMMLAMRMILMMMMMYLEHTLLNLMQSVKVEEKTSNVVQLFTTDFHLMMMMMMTITILMISKMTIFTMMMTHLYFKSKLILS